MGTEGIGVELVRYPSTRVFGQFEQPAGRESAPLWVQSEVQLSGDAPEHKLRIRWSEIAVAVDETNRLVTHCHGGKHAQGKESEVSRVNYETELSGREEPARRWHTDATNNVYRQKVELTGSSLAGSSLELAGCTFICARQS